MSDSAFIYDAIRTPRGRGKANGSLHRVKPVSLVTGLLQELTARHSQLDPAAIDDLILGCVSPVGDQGADIAKTAAIAAGLPDTVGGIQINRFCASALEAVNIASQKVALRLGPTRHRWRGRVHVAACRWAATAAPGRWTRRPRTTPTSCRRASAPT